METNFKIKKQGNFLVAFDLKDRKKTYGKINITTGKFVGDTRCLIALSEALDSYNSKLITVYLDGVKLKMNQNTLMKRKYNIVVNRTNGYSHDWQEIVPFSMTYVKNRTVYCTVKPTGEVKGSSVVSFS